MAPLEEGYLLNEDCRWQVISEADLFVSFESAVPFADTQYTDSSTHGVIDLQWPHAREFRVVYEASIMLQTVYAHALGAMADETNLNGEQSWLQAPTYIARAFAALVNDFHLEHFGRSVCCELARECPWVTEPARSGQWRRVSCGQDDFSVCAMAKDKRETRKKFSFSNRAPVGKVRFKQCYNHTVPHSSPGHAVVVIC